MKKKYTVLSLFDGISCARVAMQRIGLPVAKYYASEIDKSAAAITAKNWPDTVQLGDVTKIDFSAYAGKIDILFGGSPCQDLSAAKNLREGLRGAKSKLFFYYVDALKKINPMFFLYENVASMSSENRDVITRFLGVQPVRINSECVSAQSRDRLYWSNLPDAGTLPEKCLRVVDILDKDADNDPALRPPAHLRFEPTSGHTSRSRLIFTGGLVGGMTKRGAGRMSGDYRQRARTYSAEGVTPTLLANPGGKNGAGFWVKTPAGIRLLSSLELERLQTLPDNYTAGHSPTQRAHAIGNGWTVDVIAHLLRGLKE